MAASGATGFTATSTTIASTVRDANDLITGGIGNDVLRGNSGTDELFAGEGPDAMFGGPHSPPGDRCVDKPGDDIAEPQGCERFI